MWITKKLTRFLNLSQFFHLVFGFGSDLVLFENYHGSMQNSQNAFRRGNSLRELTAPATRSSLRLGLSNNIQLHVLSSTTLVDLDCSLSFHAVF